MELKASEFGVVLSVDALKLSRQSPLGVGIGGGGGGGGGGSCGTAGGAATYHNHVPLAVDCDFLVLDRESRLFLPSL